MNIIGAGLAGLLAGNLFQRAHIFEAGSEDQISHKAVLRFRSGAVGDAVGIEFRPVTVHKGIWFDEMFREPNIQLANFYSQKIIGRVADRSIWNLAPVQRWIAPENIVEQMAERCGSRISWGTPVRENEFDSSTDLISTMPMPQLVAMLPDQFLTAPKFKYAAIKVRRWRIETADTFQTIYFPSPYANLYRATLTGSLLIAEYIEDNGEWQPEQADEEMFRAFGIDPASATPVDHVRQRFGKIAPVDDAWRRNFILQATLKHRVYSLGRFATWRNILLDDVLHDVAVIKRIISGGAYAATRAV